MVVQHPVPSALTYDDLLTTPDDGRRYEIIDGEMLVSASPRRVHQHTAQRVNGLLVAAADEERRGCVFFAPVDVRLSRHDVVQPDLLFIRRERLGIYTPEGIVEGPPDLVVEILSPSSYSIDVLRKAKLYAWAGVPEYWLIDPSARALTVFGLLDGHYEEVPRDNGFARSLVFPDLRIDVARLFGGI